jgi:hypothetical protein
LKKEIKNKKKICLKKGKKNPNVELIINNVSCENMVSLKAVKKSCLKINNYLNPYKLTSLKWDSKVIMDK